MQPAETWVDGDVVAEMLGLHPNIALAIVVVVHKLGRRYLLRDPGTYEIAASIRTEQRFKDSSRLFVGR